MIPYEELAAALERRQPQPVAAAPVAAPLHDLPPALEDPTINVGAEDEIGEELSDDQDFTTA